MLVIHYSRTVLYLTLSSYEENIHLNQSIRGGKNVLLALAMP